tara:strand:- start:986 stop:2098 length:1113 start_codon:yes stop_codon:yes gene_type:complete
MISVSVKKQYPESCIEIVFDILRPGISALFGKSGAGKTSIINMIAGLTTPDKGQITLKDRILFDSNLDINLQPELRKIGYIFQQPRLFPHLSVQKNLLFGWNRRSPSERIIGFSEVVDFLGIANLLERAPFELSGGEAQLVQFGRAILTNPELLLMDEPLSSLDNNRRREIIPFIARLRDEFNIPILYVTHSMEEIIQLADYLLLIENGSLFASGSVEDLTTRLELLSVIGSYEVGTIINGKIEKQDQKYNLTHLSFEGGVLKVPFIAKPISTKVRLRIRASDISISTMPLLSASELNIFPGKVIEISSKLPNANPYRVVKIDIGVQLLAQLTTLSIEQLCLEPGGKIYATIRTSFRDFVYQETSKSDKF